MKISFQPKSLVLAALTLFPIAGSANTLDFEGLGLPDYGLIPANYKDHSGDTPSIGVSYQTIGVGNQISFWASSYGDLQNVGYPTRNGSLAEISFTPDAGSKVTLKSFDLAGWPQATQVGQTVKVLDAHGNVIVDYSPW
jgi:hypothetical protein